MRTFRNASLIELTAMPSEKQTEWLLGAEGSVDYLRKNSEDDEIVIYASGRSVLIHAVLALTKRLTQKNIEELQHQNIPMPDDSWSVQKVWGGGKGHRMYLEPPLTGIHEMLQGGEKLMFRRSFQGVSKGPAPIELSQKLVHSLDIHFVSERNAYCRLDSRGDIEDIIRIISSEEKGSSEPFCAVVIRRRELDQYMALSKTSLIVFFDFTRVRWGSFSGWRDISRYDRQHPDLYYHGGTDGQGSFCNGVMVIRKVSTRSKQQIGFVYVLATSIGSVCGTAHASSASSDSAVCGTASSGLIVTLAGGFPALGGPFE